MTRIITPSQTVGPFFHYCLTPADYDFTPLPVTEPDAGSEIVSLRSRILDGEGQPVPDAFVEVWHADASGRYNPPGRNSGQIGFARCPTDTTGSFIWQGIKPGPVTLQDGIVSAPHLNLSIFARGLLDRLVTRVYFDGDRLNAGDPVLLQIVPERRPTLIATLSGDRVSDFGHIIRLQGDRETVFFTV